MTNLKEYVDFITSLIEMDEVKNGKFPLPTEIHFGLNDFDHVNLYKQVLKHFGEKEDDKDLLTSFEIELMGIMLKFDR
jgi:hypothetical protein